jgi:hypothetical protein
MSTKKIAVAVLIILVAVGGFVTGLILLKENTNLSEQAAVPGGQAQVSISPSSGNFQVGDTIETTVLFNTSNISISGIAVRLVYPFSGNTPEVSVESIDLNNTLMSTGDWTCPTKTFSEQGSNVIIDIGCGNISASGFSSNADTALARIKLKVNRTPATQPLLIRFDPSLSVITRRSDNRDILLIPASTGSFTIGSGATLTPTASQTATPTPSKASGATSTLTPTPTKVATPTATKAPTGTISETSPTKVEKLPDAGVSYPTILGVGIGMMIILGALVLAF